MGLEVDEQHVRFFCNWPFDLKTGEWIQISNTFSLKEYLSKVRRLPKDKKVTIRGIRSGHLSFRMLPKGRIEFDVWANQNAVSKEGLLNYPITASPKDLLPGQNGEGKILLEQPSNGQS